MDENQKAKMEAMKKQIQRKKQEFFSPCSSNLIINGLYFLLLFIIRCVGRDFLTLSCLILKE